MAQQMSDEERKVILDAYKPQDHLISIGTNKDKSPVLYYPAAWRLYELRLRHPHFTLEAEILHMDVEKGTVIIKAIGYDGQDYASSNLKGTAMKQGKLSDLDKVETKAKSRVARDIGIGTEYALEMDPDETDATHAAHSNVPGGKLITTQKLNALYARGKKAELISSPVEFTAYIKDALDLDAPIDPKFLTEEQGRDLEAAIFNRERQLAV